jgi:hypothetical protein
MPEMSAFGGRFKVEDFGALSVRNENAGSGLRLMSELRLSAGLISPVLLS